MAVAVAPAPELFARPPRGTIPLSKGGDLVIDFLQINEADGLLTPYGVGVTVTLVIDITVGSPPSLVEATATINDYHAVCVVQSEVTDLIPAGVPWRCVVSYPTIPTREIVAMNGIISRADQ